MILNLSYIIPVKYFYAITEVTFPLAVFIHLYYGTRANYAVKRKVDDMKKRVLPIVITAVVWFLLYYITLPPMNVQSEEFWTFLVIAIVAAVVINLWSIVKGLFGDKADRGTGENKKLRKVIVAIVGAAAAFYIVGSFISSPILRAGAYRELLPVETGNFKEDIQEVNYSQIPLLDRDSAAILAEREMGSMADMVSQFEVSSYYNQINYNNRPFRVTPLQYGDVIKWLTNQKTGIPGYITIDMTTQDTTLVRLEEGIKISPFEHFNRNLQRYLRFRYPTSMFRGYYFEIDDEGTPYWICPVETRRIGLFGGVDIKGAVVVNGITGDHIYYDIQDVPTWIDKVYDADLLIEQYDYYGTLKHGFLNSVFGQRDCLKTTEGYNYIALNDDVWVYTGVTSVGADESLVGFMLMNQRTKESRYYAISGAKEISAMSSAEGQVQHLGYQATFPILLNIGGEPTYFLSLKDGAGLVKKYAMVNIEKYQIVAIGDTVSQCEEEYKKLMASSGIETTDVSEAKTVQGVVSLTKDIVVDGNTIYYIMLEGDDRMFEVNPRQMIQVIALKEGDTVVVSYVEGEAENVMQVVALE